MVKIDEQMGLDPALAKKLETEKNKSEAFEEFKTGITNAVSSGVLKFSAPLNELDLAVLYAIEKEIKEQGGGELTATPREIMWLVFKHCGEEVYERVFGDEQ